MDATNVLEASLEPVSRSLNADAARKLLKLRAPVAMERRINELATRCNEGAASSQELAEYDAMINASNLIGILQAEARNLLHPKAD